MAGRKRSSTASQRQKTSASIVTQKTTLPQVETIKQRDQVYQVSTISKFFQQFISFIVEIQTNIHTNFIRY